MHAMEPNREVDTIVQARWVVPVEPPGTVLEDYAVVVDEGRIVALLPAGEARRRFNARARHELDRHLLIPGFVNAHTHAAMSLFKGLADDLPLMTWLQEHIWPAEARWVSEDFVRDGTRLACAEMLRGGTTCFNDMYFCPGEAARVTAQCGIRAVVGLIVLDLPTMWAGNAAEYLDKGMAVHDLVKDEPLVHTALAPHAPYTVSDGPLERIRMLADELDIPIHMHVHETASEVSEAVDASGERPLQRLERLELVCDRLVAVHMTQLEAEEIELLAHRGAHVVHCPESNLKLASGLCPAARLLEAGVNVAIGTDGAASNNDLNMLGETRVASLLAKGVARDAAAVPAETALRMATLGGARALGLDALIGSLEPGKAADMVAVDLVRVETQPTYHPISQLVYAASSHQVTDVWVAGRSVLRGRELITMNTGELAAIVDRWRPRIQSTDEHPEPGP